MFIKKTAFCLTLLISIWQTCYPVTLTNQMLATADKAGLFRTGLLEILRVRDHIKHLITGKYNWHGAQINLTLEHATTGELQTVPVLVRKPEALMGASYLVLNPDHALVQQPQTASLLKRYKTHDTSSTPTQWRVIHPITNEKLPVIVADYRIEHYETRTLNAHLAIPAHDSTDFAFAKEHNLPIKLVITSPDKGRSSSPRINRSTGALEMAYQGDYSDCLIVNSGTFDGPIKTAREKVLDTLTTRGIAAEHAQPLKYYIHNTAYTIQELEMIENTLETQPHQLLNITKDQLNVVLLQAQTDFVALVEQFLINAHDTRDLMVDLIEESCTLRNTPHAYLLKWAHMNTNESEVTIFQRDITSFQQLVRFWSELINFLGDFASSCPHTIAALKQMKK